MCFPFPSWEFAGGSRPSSSSVLTQGHGLSLKHLNLITGGYIYGMLVCLKIPSTIFNPQSMMQPYVAVYQDKKWTRQKGMQKDAK